MALDDIVNQARLKISNYKTALKNKQVIIIVEKIISSLPLSFINLERIRKEINSLREPFWIKDENGKYLLVNEKFASNFHLPSSQLEGKSVEKFIPAYLLNFSKALEGYIKESGSVFITEGFPWSGTSGGEDNQIIEIPVYSTEGNLNAIIGVAQETEEGEQPALKASLSMFKNFLKEYLLINNENKVTEVSEEFCNTFSLKKEEVKEKVYNSNESGIPVIISTMINDFLQSGKKTNSVSITIPHVPGFDFTLHFLKGKEEETLLVVEKKSAGELNSDQDYQTYNFMIENIPEPVFIYDKEDLRFLQVNNLALKLYGYRKDEFLQLDLTDLYAPDDIQTLAESSDEKLNNGTAKPHRQKRKDGKNIFVELNRTVINYKDKPAYLNLARDVTEKLNLEKAGKNFNSLFNSSGDLIFITDKEGFIKSVNNTVTDILGFSNKNLLESSFTSLLIDEERGKINSTVFQTGLKEKFTIETSLKKSGKESLQVKLIANPVFDFNNEVESYSIICSPLQEKVEIIKEVIKEVPIETISETAAASAIPEINFLSGIFHDMITPINVILGFVQDLTENIEQPTSEQKESLQIINQNKENLLGLLNHIIEFVQIEKEPTQLEYEQVKVINIIEELISGSSINRILSDGEFAFGKISSSLEITTDKEKMLHLLILLINLISKITGQKKLYISAEPVGKNHFSISLKDNYNNSSQNYIEKSVEVFSGKMISKKIPGIPSITIKLFQSYLNMLKGEFKTSEISSDPAFIFPVNLKQKSREENNIRYKTVSNISEEIEINQSQEKVIEKISEAEKPIQKKEPAVVRRQTSIDLSQLRCLYIEDHLDSQMLFSIQMKDLKEIDFAVSLEQAIPQLNKKKYDFIIVDINLQGDYNGLDILKILRTMPNYENTPVIAVTAYILPADREVYIQAGFTDFISKPLLRENLINSFERRLEFQA